VRSWIFRHRLRLRAIYGQRPEIRPSSTIPERAPRPTIDGLRPGECARRGRWFVLRPNSPAA